MDVLLLGNGFDLNHMFPTSYINFINTVVFLMEEDREALSKIGHVFKNNKLQEKDLFIKKCYEKHHLIYDNTVLDKKLLEAMIELLQKNLWFKYLAESVAKNITWIDFEKEIVRVLEAFSNFFENTTFDLVNDRVIFNIATCQGQEDQYIIKKFMFFFKKLEHRTSFNTRMMQIKNEYIREKIVGSGTYHLCEDKIIAELYNSLRELADGLKMYLTLFIDIPSKEYDKLNIKSCFDSLPSATRVYSFNYTNTYEILYRPNIVEHIHGNTNTDIVLGVNPDESDEVHSIDTAFLQFKKYFQRTLYSTDNTFLKKIYEQKNSHTSVIQLYVVGHSLDVTDKDIIKLVFEASDKIFVLYHSDISVKNQIKNLVEIYGKEGLDKLRSEKNLCFIKQSHVDWKYPQ